MELTYSTADLAVAIDELLGSFDRFRGQLSAAGAKRQRSGWANLVYWPVGERLLTRNVKADPAEVFWQIMDWDDFPAGNAAAAGRLTLP